MAAGDVTVNNNSLNARKGAYFDGVDDKITFSATGFDLNTIGTTFLFWMKRSRLATDEKIIGNSTSAFDKWIEIIVGNALRFETDTNNDTAGTITSDDLLWHHYAFAAIGLNVKGYKDGVDVSMADETVTDSTITLNNFGTDNGTKYFKGVISDFRIYKGQLSATQIANIYAGIEITDAILLHHWKFDTDYTDSAGALNGTNSGTRLGIFDDTVAAAVAAARVTANDRYMISSSANGQQIITTHIEEAP